MKATQLGNLDLLWSASLNPDVYVAIRLLEHYPPLSCILAGRDGEFQEKSQQVQEEFEWPAECWIEGGF